MREETRGKERRRMERGKDNMAGKRQRGEKRKSVIKLCKERSMSVTLSIYVAIHLNM